MRRMLTDEQKKQKHKEKTVNSKRSILRDPEKKQETWNSGAGLPIVTEGAQIEQAQIDACVKRINQSSDLITLGSDVGGTGHVTVKKWYRITTQMKGFKVNDVYFPETIHQEVIKDENFWSILKDLLYDFKCKAAVVDRHPEINASAQFTRHMPGRIARCVYNYNQNSRTVSYDKDDRTLTVNRSAWLDYIFARIKKQAIALPANRHPDYDAQIKCLIRVMKRDKNGIQYVHYENENKPDHFAHSDVYSELALPFALKDSNIYPMEEMY